MVLKKRSLPLPTTADTGATSHVGAPPIRELSLTKSIKVDCERAMLPLRRNNHAEALRLIEDTCLRHPNSVIAHRTQAYIHHQAASKITDPAAKQQHLQNAVVSARRAITLSPGSIEHVDFLCGLVFKPVSDARAQEEVVRECERPLAVEDPIDPADDTTIEERLESVCVEWRSHMQKSRAVFTDEIGDTNVPKATRGDELNVVQEEKEEEPHFPAGQTAGSPRSVTDELEQQEEEEIKRKEMLERPTLIEDEAKQKNLAKKTTNEASDSVIRINLEASGSVIQLKLEASCRVKAEIYVDKMQLNLEGISSVMAHRDPSLRKRKAPEDFSGAPVTAKSPKDSSRASVSRQNIGSRCHSKVKQARKNLPLTTSAQLEESNRFFLLAPGMKNDGDEFNCFLNVVVQSLWNLETFRCEFLSRSTSAHEHFGHPCVVCALHEVLNSLSLASENMQREAVSPAPLRIALSTLFPQSNLFKQRQQNDASEVLLFMLDALHKSFTPGTGVSDAEPLGSQKCDSIARLFEVEIVTKVICQYCGTESRQQNCTYHSYYFDAGALRSAKTTGTNLDELLRLARNKESVTCDPAVKGCGKDNNLHHILSIPPFVFTLVLGWGTPTESIDDISKTLEALSDNIDLGVAFDGLDPGHSYSLVSMVCYGGRHYICFVYNLYHEEWILYDDEIVQVIGSDWENVTWECKKKKFQPTVLFFQFSEIEK